jgi:signal peptidase I
LRIAEWEWKKRCCSLGPSISTDDLVKRVIGLPGDHLTSKANTVYVNGKPLAEPWLPATGKPPSSE